MSENWRTPVDGADYLQQQKKQLEVADRRPVVRQASDLVGPGIGSTAVRLDDYNDLLATFNGYYSSAPGALSAPNDTDAFVGHVVSDEAFGGAQVFTSLGTGIEYRRRFVRSPVDPEAIAWGLWSGESSIKASATGYSEADTDVLSGTAATLIAPSITTVGSPTYERSTGTIKVLRQGVYTGYIQVGDRVGATVLSQLAVFLPDGTTTRPLAQLTVPLAATVHIPFTVIALDGRQGFSVAALHTSGSPRTVWWRFSCTRVGDAI